MSWQTGGMIVGALAVVYGLTVAFGLRSLSHRSRTVVVNGGALVLLALLIVLVLIPWMRVM